MAKHNCAICGTEVGLFAQQQLADKNYICRKVCAKRCMKLFDFVPSTLEQVKKHIEQVEYGTKVWEQIFVPLAKAKKKEEKIKSFGENGMLRVSPSTGLVALIQNDYKIFIFGKTTKACVYRIADLYSYEYVSEVQRGSDGKDVTKHFCVLAFSGVSGMPIVRLPIGSAADFTYIEKYFNKQFGIQKTLGNAINNAKRQINAIKSVTEAVKSAVNGEIDEEKGEAAIDALNANFYGDRTEWIRKADEALSKVK
ncbi:MAG: hypothetical protein E7660_00740 [Ruminococcaceae bacterium]|nr:hypothetical protein [Oscillospiraceae bacterium]